MKRRDDLVAASRAAVVSSPRSVISHRGAAAMLGLPLLGASTTPCLTVPAGTALRRVRHAHLHRATLAADDVISVGSDVVTAPARTVLDVAREFGIDAGVVAADAALRDGLVTPESLGTAWEQCQHWPGRKAARLTVLLADGLAESPLESLSRLRMVALHLPRPQLQVEIRDSAGRFLGRSDFYFDEFGVVGEADGDLKYDDSRSIVLERARHELFEDTGLVVVRWGWRATRAFSSTAERLRHAFERGARSGSPRRRWQAIPTVCTPGGG